jgi:hypothetical protein
VAAIIKKPTTIKQNAYVLAYVFHPPNDTSGISTTALELASMEAILPRVMGSWLSIKYWADLINPS